MTSNDKAKLSRLLHGGAWTAGLRILTIGFMLLSNAWITRNLDKPEAGVYLTAYGIVYFLAVLGQLGLRTAVVRWIADATVNENSAQTRSAITTTTKMLHCSFATIIAIAWFAYGIATTAQMTLPFSAYDLGWMSVWLLGIGIQYTLPEVYRAQQQYAFAAFCNGTLSNALVLLGFWIHSLLFDALSLTHVLAVIAIAGMVNYSMIMLPMLLSLAGLDKGEARQTKDVLSESLPMLGTHVSTGALALLDTALVGLLAGPTQAALYGIAARLAVLINLPLQISSSVVSPTLASSFARDDKKQMETVARLSALISAVPGIIAVIAYVTFGKTILGLFGDYADAWPILVLLSCAHLAVLLAGPVNSALMLTGHQRTAMKLSGFVALGFVVMQFVLTPKFGGIGSAAVVAGAYLTLACLQSFASRQLVGIQCHVGLSPLRMLSFVSPKS